MHTLHTSHIQPATVLCYASQAVTVGAFETTGGDETMWPGPHLWEGV